MSWPWRCFVHFPEKKHIFIELLRKKVQKVPIECSTHSQGWRSNKCTLNQWLSWYIPIKENKKYTRKNWRLMKTDFSELLRKGIHISFFPLHISKLSRLSPQLICRKCTKDQDRSKKLHFSMDLLDDRENWLQLYKQATSFIYPNKANFKSDI